MERIEERKRRPPPAKACASNWPGYSMSMGSCTPCSSRIVATDPEASDLATYAAFQEAVQRRLALDVWHDCNGNEPGRARPRGC
jgi:hypothetical protein